jgi:hypothetical protein
VLVKYYTTFASVAADVCLYGIVLSYLLHTVFECTWFFSALGSSLFWVVMQCWFAVYRFFRTAYLSYRNVAKQLPNIREHRRHQLPCDGNLQSFRTC